MKNVKIEKRVNSSNLEKNIKNKQLRIYKFIYATLFLFFTLVAINLNQISKFFKIDFVQSSKNKVSTKKNESNTTKSCNKVTAYLPEYRLEYFYENIVFFSRYVDEINLFSVVLTEKGDLFNSDKGLTKKKIKRFCLEAKRNGIPKVLLTVGGAQRSQGFSIVSSTENQILTFSKELYIICKKYNLDGINFDWEIPENKKELEQYNNLLQEVKRYFIQQHKKDSTTNSLLVTVALHYWQTLNEKTLNDIDRVNLMTYDMNHHHSGLSTTIRAFKFFKKKTKIESNKLLLGIPAYGRCAENPNVVFTHREIIENEKFNGNDEFYSTEKNCLVSFSNMNTLREKKEFCKMQNLYGLFLWELGQDSVKENLSIIVNLKSNLN